MERIRKYISELFKDVPRSKQARELQEELIYDLEEKYSDLIKEGQDEKTAYENVISGIGDIDELLREFNDNSVIKETRNRKKTALYVSISLGLYIISLISVVVLEEVGAPEFVAVSSFLSLAGIATCILVYHFMSTPKYSKVDETMVEEFKEWKNGKNKNKQIKESISSILWTITVIVYILISFSFSIWHISWIIFLIAAVVEQIINLIFKLGE